jgi:hypothetical protein
MTQGTDHSVEGETMRKITAGLFISLDGVVEAPDQWHFPYFNEEMGAAVDATPGASPTRPALLTVSGIASRTLARRQHPLCFAANGSRLVAGCDGGSPSLWR